MILVKADLAERGKQMTVRELILDIKKIAEKDKSIYDKEILLSDDEEGNSYHGCYYSFTSDPKDVKECIECSNGADRKIDDYSKYVILG